MGKELRCIAGVGKTTFEVAVPAPDFWSTDLLDDLRTQATRGCIALLPEAPDSDGEDGEELSYDFLLDDKPLGHE